MVNPETSQTVLGWPEFHQWLFHYHQRSPNIHVAWWNPWNLVEVPRFFPFNGLVVSGHVTENHQCSWENSGHLPFSPAQTSPTKRPFRLSRQGAQPTYRARPGRGGPPTRWARPRLRPPKPCWPEMCEIAGYVFLVLSGKIRKSDGKTAHV